MHTNACETGCCAMVGHGSEYKGGGVLLKRGNMLKAWMVLDKSTGYLQAKMEGLRILGIHKNLLNPLTIWLS